jgi:hypothetical protein
MREILRITRGKRCPQAGGDITIVALDEAHPEPRNRQSTLALTRRSRN